MIHEICIYFRVIFEPTTFAGIIFFGDFSVIKARKLHQTRSRCKTCPFDELADRGLRTNHSDSDFEGLESAIMDKNLQSRTRICNHGQESWDKYALLAFLRTRQTRIQPLLPNLAPTPPPSPYNVENN